MKTDKYIHIEINQDHKKSVVRLEDGTILKGVFRVQVEYEVGYLPVAVLYLHPKVVSAVISEDEFKIVESNINQLNF